jgi:cell division protein FtsQ
MNKIVNISIWGIAIVLIVVVLGFVNVTKKQRTFQEPIVHIDYDTDNRFIDATDILAQVLNREDTGVFVLDSFDVTVLENKLANNHSVKDAQVYKTVDGELVINIKQRRPIVRVFPENGLGYYIDEMGALMPLSTRYTARLLVVNGMPNEPYAKRYLVNYNQLEDSLRDQTMLDDIYEISNYIDKSDFWKAQIEQIHVNKMLDLVLIPKVGNHKIVFGGIENLEGKFEKLMIFYKKGLSKTGWNEYSVINLKYKNQVVCTKRYE